MGTSILGYLQKIKSGVLYSETFENQNWFAAEGWTNVQGTPTYATNMSYQGLNSFICSGAGATLSIIKKSVTGSGTWIQCYFFDDGTTVAATALGPFLKVKTNGGNYWQVGVRNDVSNSGGANGLGYYVYGGPADESFAYTSTASRSIGWHRFDIYITSGFLIVGVDGFSSGTAHSTTDASFTEFHLCSGKTSDTLATFGNFDSIYAFSGTVLTMLWKGTTRSGILYDSAFEFLGSLSGAGYGILVFSETAFPVSGYLQISQNGVGAALEHQSVLTNFFPGDVYVYQSIDFGRKVTDWQPKENSLKNINQSTSGVQEVLFNGYKGSHMFMVDYLLGQQTKNKLNNFYDYCSKGYPFSMMIDSANGALGVLDTNALIGSTSVLLEDGLSAYPTDGFTVERSYQIFDAQRTIKQKVTLASKDTNTLTFHEYLTEPFAQGDFICDDTFQPFLEIGQSTDGFTYKSGRNQFVGWAQQCQEFTSA
jgi:hypothetical protein